MIIISTLRCKDGEVTQSHGVVLQTEEKRLLLRSLATQTPDDPWAISPRRPTQPREHSTLVWA